MPVPLIYRDLFPFPDAWKASGDVAKPTYGCQVTIQSEQEKQMMKMQRREEKKDRKKGKGAEEGDSSDAALAFDPREMRALRCVVLQTFPSSFSSSSSLVRPALRRQALAFVMTAWGDLSQIQPSPPHAAASCTAGRSDVMSGVPTRWDARCLHL